MAESLDKLVEQTQKNESLGLDIIARDIIHGLGIGLIVLSQPCISPIGICGFACAGYAGGALKVLLLPCAAYYQRYNFLNEFIIRGTATTLGIVAASQLLSLIPAY